MKRWPQYADNLLDICKSWFNLMDWKLVETVGGLNYHAAGSGLISYSNLMRIISSSYLALFA